MKNLLLTGIAMAIVATQINTGDYWLGVVLILLLANFIFECKKHCKI